MDLTPGQQRLVFVVVVIVLVGLGLYVLSESHHGATATPSPSPSPTATPPTTGGSSGTGGPSASASAVVPPATVPPASPPATTAGGANIYEWLPFSQADLTGAAKTTLAFAGDYVNWSYTESKAAYGAKLATVATPGEVATLENDQYGTAGAGQIIADKQVSTGTGTIESIRAFGASPTSITFLVSTTQKLASTTGTKTSTPTYVITTVSTGTGWQVSNIQLSTIGNT
jgi:hypothetical protein